MKVGNVILLMFGTIALTGGAIAFGYLLSQDEEEPSASTARVAGTSSNGGLDVGESSGLGNLFNSQDSTRVDNNNAASTSSSLPEPSGFGVYEEYADQTTALYSEIAAGSGQEAAPGDTVAVIYEGWLTDGTKFDESKKNDKGEYIALSFEVGAGQVIAGWEQGIVGMKVGGRRRLVIPPSVGYGDKKQGSIPPNSMLIFDVQLVQVQNPSAANSGL